MSHLDDDLIQRFVAVEATRVENRQVVLHLLQGCAECAARMRRLWRPKVAEEDYEGILEKVVLAPPRAAAPAR